MAEIARLPEVAMLVLRRRDARGLPAIGKSAWQASARVIAVGPDEWLIVGADGDDARLARDVAALGGVQVNVSGNRVLYRVAGPDALDLLAAGCAFDLERLPIDGAVATLFARAQVIIVREAGDAFAMLPRRSFAGFIERWMGEVMRT